MEYLVLTGVIGLFIFFGVRKFKKASQGKDCCK
jgi:hypothetical protein